MRQAQLPKHPVSTKLSQLASLSGSVAVAVLRHAALQRHVGMNADPAFVVVSGKNDGRPTWPIEAAAISLESGASPRCDHRRDAAVSAREYDGIVQVEGEI